MEKVFPLISTLKIYSVTGEDVNHNNTFTKNEEASVFIMIKVRK
jgi:hypothetical protein